MYRKFRFEGETHTVLDCVPLAVRRKLDLSLRKISLVGWQSLSRNERLVLCHLPVETDEEIVVYRAFLEEVAARAQTVLTELLPFEGERWHWCTTEPPTAVSERLTAEHLSLRHEWQALNEEERYCLLKYCDRKKPSDNLRALVAELNERVAH